jgi:hypothetical protein
VAPSTIRYLKPTDGMGVGVERLVLYMEHVFTGGPPPALGMANVALRVVA